MLPRSESNVAVLHEWVTAHAGSEAVFEELCAIFPTASLFALARKPSVPIETHGREIVTSRLDRLFWSDRTRPLAVLATPFAARKMIPSDVDAVISSSHALCRSAVPIGVTHLSYTHSPVRYAWYPEIDGRAANGAAAPIRAWMRSRDYEYAANVTAFAANSSEVSQRILDCYGRDSVVIHPPCDVDYFTPPETSEANKMDDPFILSLGRMVPYKRHDLAVEVAISLGMRAVIAGDGPEYERLQSRVAEARPGQIRLVRSPTREQVRDLYRAAAVTLFPPHEDFGIVPVESMACGTPVVALRAGGSLDSVGDSGCGVLCHAPTVEAFVAGTQKLLSAYPSAESCVRRAALFGKQTFRESFTSWTRSELASVGKGS